MHFIFSIKQFNKMTFTNMEFFDICIRNSGKLKTDWCLSYFIYLRM